jgi:hypothetical protein
MSVCLSVCPNWQEQPQKVCCGWWVCKVLQFTMWRATCRQVFLTVIYNYQTGVAKDNALGRVKKWGVRKKTSRVNGFLQCTWVWFEFTKCSESKVLSFLWHWSSKTQCLWVIDTCARLWPFISCLHSATEVPVG